MTHPSTAASPSGAAVAAGNADTVSAAVEVLREGGNAVDAALAAGFAAGVAEPALSSLGGGGFLLARAPGEDAVLLDFFVDAPGRGRPPGALEPHFTPVPLDFLGVEQVFHVGWGSVAVPGCLDGFLQAHRRLGRLPLDDVVAPAARMAREGVHLDATQAGLLDLVSAILLLSAEGRAMFAPGGNLLRPGEVLRNEALGAFLDEIAAGRVTSLADDGVAGPLTQAMDAGGGLVTVDDLNAYQVCDREPLVVTHRGARITTNPPPSFGGSLVTQALRGSVSLADVVDLVPALMAMAGAHPPTPSSVKGTTHVSVIDRDGGVASLTTSNGSCSGMVVPGTGIALNNIMGEADLHPDGFHVTPPGTRIGSMMAPTLLDRPDGSTVVLGSGGSERIRSALLQVIAATLDAGLSPAEAVLAPRLHWDRDVLQVEPGLDAATLSRLRAEHPVNLWSAQHLYFGGVHAVGHAADGTVTAVGDPRRGGAAAAGL